jgi:hypothetical protein
MRVGPPRDGASTATPADRTGDWAFAADPIQRPGVRVVSIERKLNKAAKLVEVEREQGRQSLSQHP